MKTFTKQDIRSIARFCTSGVVEPREASFDSKDGRESADHVQMWFYFEDSECYFGMRNPSDWESVVILSKRYYGDPTFCERQEN